MPCSKPCNGFPPQHDLAPIHCIFYPWKPTIMLSSQIITRLLPHIYSVISLQRFLQPTSQNSLLLQPFSLPCFFLTALTQCDIYWFIVCSNSQPYQKLQESLLLYPQALEQCLAQSRYSIKNVLFDRLERMSKCKERLV